MTTRLFFFPFQLSDHSQLTTSLTRHELASTPLQGVLQ
jgi:hypothetical protein